MLDPFVKVHGLEENDNAAMDFVCELLTKLAIEKNIAVDAPHHTKKGALVAGDADNGRGASGIRDAGRLVYTLATMSDDEAKTFGIPESQRRFYVRLDNAKVNIAPPAQKAEWFKLIGVRLNNGTAEYPNGDEVQTVVPWAPPDTWANPIHGCAQRRPDRDRRRHGQWAAILGRHKGNRPRRMGCCATALP
jgi:hypothetical protein